MSHTIRYQLHTKKENYFDIYVGQYSKEDENVIKNRSIRKEDNPENYKERLSELHSPEFANAVYAYNTHSKTNERNAMTYIFSIATLHVQKVGMAQASFFNSVTASKKSCKIQLRPLDNENECGSMFEQLPLCIGTRVIFRRNIDFDVVMVNETEAIVKGIVWNSDDKIVLPMTNRYVFPKLERAIRVVLPKYVELAESLINVSSFSTRMLDTAPTDT